jgi:hypothetical protein
LVARIIAEGAGREPTAETTGAVREVTAAGAAGKEAGSGWPEEEAGREQAVESERVGSAELGSARGGPASFAALRRSARGVERRDEKKLSDDSEERETLFNPPLELLAGMSEEEFREVFRGSPVKRAKYRGFLRNVAVAMGNSGRAEFRPLLEKLAEHSDPLVQEHARWALKQLRGAAPDVP